MGVNMKTAIIFITSLISFSLFSSDFNRIVKTELEKSCNEIKSFEIKNLSIPESVIKNARFSGKQLCFSGFKKVFADTADGVKVVTFDLTVKADVLMFADSYPKGTPLTRDMVITSRERIDSRSNRRYIYSIKGKETRNFVAKGAKVTKNLLKKRILIKRGDIILANYSRKGINIIVEAVALGNGSINDTINIKNSQSGKILRGVVLGSGKVVVGGRR